MMTDIRTTAEAAESDAIPRVHEVHADPNRPCTSGADIPENMKAPTTTKSPAQWAYERLILYIQKFEETLDEEHEVAMGFTNGGGGLMRIEGMGYFDPDIVTFYGQDQLGTRTQLVQHVSQLSVMLRATTKQPEAKEPTRIGFRLAADLDNDEQA